MNTFPSLPQMSPVPPASTAPRPPCGWREWLRRLLVCNPFFLVSAALLLFGVNRLSVDPGFLGDERANLFFNFGALQFYGALLTVTAVLLARRRVWYDSALLVVLEHGLVLVPFILISQAALLGPGVAALLVLAGAAMAAGRAAAIRHWYPRFNLPPRALALGVVVLAANVALPLWFRAVVNATSVVNWPGPNRLVWLGVLPLLAAGANLLPRPAHHGGLNPERSWLPLFIYGLWLAGSGVHAASVAYLGKGSVLTPALFAPLVVILAWTFWNRLRDFTPEPSLDAQRVCLGLATLAPLLAVAEPAVLMPLTLANLAALTVLRCFRTDALRRFAGQLALGCLVVALVGVPGEWIQRLNPGWGRLEFLAAALGVLAVLASWWSRQPVVGVCGGLALVLGTFRVADEVPRLLVWQAGLMLMLVHSLRWEDASPLARRLRRSVALVWLLSAFTPVNDRWAAAPLLQGLAMLVVWAAAWWLTRRPRSWIIPLAGAGVSLSQPLSWTAAHGSPGLLAVAASFLLFGAGTCLAWRRRHPEPVTALPDANRE